MTIERFTNVLVLAPHTDDGEFGCGGTMARLIEGGARVTYAAFCTAAKSVPEGFPRDVLKREVRAATGVLGIPEADLRVYDFEVRTFPTVRQEILEEMIVLQQELRPGLRADAGADRPPPGPQDHRRGGPARVQAHDGDGLRDPLEQHQLSTTRPTCASRSATSTRRSQALACYESQGHRNYTREDYIRNIALTRGIDVGLRLRRGLRGLPLDPLRHRPRPAVMTLPP